MTNNEYIKSHWPLLATIDTPADLRRLSVDQLPQVCTELREFMIQSLEHEGR